MSSGYIVHVYVYGFQCMSFLCYGIIHLIMYYMCHQGNMYSSFYVISLHSSILCYVVQFHVFVFKFMSQDYEAHFISLPYKCNSFYFVESELFDDLLSMMSKFKRSGKIRF